jgi:hypothetical protein
MLPKTFYPILYRGNVYQSINLLMKLFCIFTQFPYALKDRATKGLMGKKPIGKYSPPG